MLSALGRASVRRVTGGAIPSSARIAYRVQRVSFNKRESQQDTNGTSAFRTSFRRSFATATKSTVKHTRTTTAKSKTATKKAAPKKKVAGKSKKKAAKPKPKAVKKAPTEAALARRAKLADSTKLKDLKEKALYHKEPARLPANAWSVYFSTVSKEALIGSTNPNTLVSSVVKEAAEKYKNMSVVEREDLNHTANTNAKANETTYKKWIESHSPEVIRQANLARLSLKRLVKSKEKSGSKVNIAVASLKPLTDDRAVKRSKNVFSLFVVSRWASGDFNGISLSDVSKRLSEEWKTLSESEKKVFNDQAKSDALRYQQEYRTVYGRDPSPASP